MKTFSEDYKEQVKELHNRSNAFGNGKLNIDKEPPCLKYVDEYSVKTLIDYGCGKAAKLPHHIKHHRPEVDAQGYDPFVPGFDVIQLDSYDMLTSDDVLEHFEYEHIDDGIRHVNSLFTKVAWISVACSPAKKVLADGRNAHLIVEGPEWWKEKLTGLIDGKMIYDKYVEGEPKLLKGRLPYQRKKYTTVWVKE